MPKQTVDDKISAVFGDYARVVYRFCYLRLNNREQAEDITSAVFEKLLKLEQIDENKIKAWLLTVARNLMYDKFRTAKNEDSLDAYSEEYGEPRAEDLTVEEALVDAELVESLKSELEHLQPIEREIIGLKIWEELTFAEIAPILDMKENTVKVRYYRGLEKLKSNLERNPGQKRRYALALPLIIVNFAQLSKSHVFQPSRELLQGLMQTQMIAKATGTKIAAAVATVTASVAIVAVGVAAINGQKPANEATPPAPMAATETPAESPAGTPANPATPGQTPGTPAAVETVKFNGKYLNFVLPKGWTATEYENGNQLRQYLSEPFSNYTGFTGLQIKNASGKVVATLQAIYGIGGQEVCEKIYKFGDTSAEFIKQQQQIAKDLGAPAPQIIDVTNASYREFKLLRLKGRLIAGGTLLWNSNFATTGFNHDCYSPSAYIEDGGLKFNIKDDGTRTDYMADTVKDISDADIQTLTAVFDSMTAK